MPTETRPATVNILGKHFSIQYVDRPSDVDIHGRKSLWGQCDHWTHSIRVYAPPNFSHVEIWDTILHEVIHVLVAELRIKPLEDQDDAVGLLALGVADTLFRNGWISLEEGEDPCTS